MLPPPPHEALSAHQRSKIRKLAAPSDPSPEESGGEINIVPFLDIVTNVLMFVLATLAITFTATIDTSPVQRRPGPRSESKLGLTVLVVPEGFSMKTQGGNVATGCSEAGAGIAVPKRGADYDFNALKTCAAKLKGAAPELAVENGVTISASPQISYDVVIATLDALRTSEAGQDLFPDVSFAIAR